MTAGVRLENSKTLAFCWGFFVSFLAGTFTSGVCAAYLFVVSLSFRLSAFLRLAGRIPNESGLVLLFTALLHGAIFVGIVFCMNWFLARTKYNGKSTVIVVIFLVYLVYAFLLMFAFPYTRDAL